MAAAARPSLIFSTMLSPAPISPLVEPYLDASALQKRDEAFSQPHAQPFRHSLLALMRIIRDDHFFLSEVCKKGEALDTIGGDSVPVNSYGTAKELAEIVPVEGPAVLEFPHETHRIKSIPRLPEFEHHKAADEWLIEWPVRKDTEIVNIARFVPLITGAEFLSYDLGQREAGDFRGHER